MDKLKNKTKISVEIVIALCILILFTISAAVNLFQPQQNKDVQLANVVRLLELESDGGFFYQNVEAYIKKENKFINVRIQLKDLGLEELKIGDNIYVSKVDTNIGEVYSFSGYKRSTNLLWILLIFFSLLAVMLGKIGIKYIFATILVFLLVGSGLLSKILTDYNIYLASVLILVVTSFTSILVQVKNVKLATIVSISQAITLIIILLLNLILFKITFLVEIFYTDITFISAEVSLIRFWSIINAAVLFISFGASINTALDVAMGIVAKKSKYPAASTLNLIREGTRHNQLATARVINSLFFVFLGMALVYLLLAQNNNFVTFWDDPRIVQMIILFINSSLAAVFVGPITAIISAILLSGADKANLELKLEK